VSTCLEMRLAKKVKFEVVRMSFGVAITCFGKRVYSVLGLERLSRDLHDDNLTCVGPSMD